VETRKEAFERKGASQKDPPEGVSAGAEFDHQQYDHRGGRTSNKNQIPARRSALGIERKLSGKPTLPKMARKEGPGPIDPPGQGAKKPAKLSSLGGRSSLKKITEHRPGRSLGPRPTKKGQNPSSEERQGRRRKFFPRITRIHRPAHERAAEADERLKKEGKKSQRYKLGPAGQTGTWEQASGGKPDVGGRRGKKGDGSRGVTTLEVTPAARLLEVCIDPVGRSTLGDVSIGAKKKKKMRKKKTDPSAGSTTLYQSHLDQQQTVKKYLKR